MTNKTSSIEINPLRIENSLKNKQQQQQQQQQQPKQQLPQNKSPNKEKLTSQNHLGNKSTRSKKTKVLPKAKNKADTKHKVNKNNRTVPDTLAEMKETRIENPYKKTTPKPQSAQIQKEKEVEDTHMEEETINPEVPTQQSSNKTNTPTIEGEQTHSGKEVEERHMEEGTVNPDAPTQQSINKIETSPNDGRKKRKTQLIRHKKGKRKINIWN